MAREPVSSSRRRFVRDRHTQIAEFYAREAGSLERALTRSVVAPTAMIEDACSHAWFQLLRHDEVELGPGGFWWLYVCAKHEVYRLSGRARREPAGGEPVDLPEDPTQVAEDVSVAVEQRAEHDARRTLLGMLTDRRRRMVVLAAAGFTYEEIARTSGDSMRTVERQLVRGRQALQRLQAAAEA